jgi:adenylate cyclase
MHGFSPETAGSHTLQDPNVFPSMKPTCLYIARRLRTAAIVGMLIGILGANLAPLAHHLEEGVGLHLLFKLRGTRPPPDPVVIISLDRRSAERLGVREEPRHWPHSLHARLVERLSREGAAVIVFDILFDEARSAENNRMFARAIRDAGNVVLCECLRKETIPMTAPGRVRSGDISIVRLVPPIPVLADAAAALAPFPLPKVPVKVSQYWTFKSDAGGMPTLPVVAFQIFSLRAYDELVRWLNKIDPAQAAGLPADGSALLAARDAGRTVRAVRDIFDSRPRIGKTMQAELKASARTPAGPEKARTAALIKMYSGANSRYLNFYGPPGAIPTVPYSQAFQDPAAQGALPQPQIFARKAVFIGLSELTQADQKDGFYTAFSQKSGINISGVEIAATAFANLLEGMHVRPLDFRMHLAALLLWGFVLGGLCLLLPAGIAVVSAWGLGVLYLAASHHLFKMSGIWLPLVVPLCFQLPVACFAALVWKYIRTNRERRNIRRAFGYYLPDGVVDRLALDISDITTGSRLVYGTCLFTDAEKYTTLSETMPPEELSRFMNRYYESIFAPVRERGGIVSDVVGDAMMAIWATGHPDAALRRQACLTALDIAEAVHHFNQSSPEGQLPTRMGLHSGRMMLGSIGAIDHYEYRAVGDVVNSASRLEGLNKHLGTQIIVSEAVLHQLDGFLTRPLGNFLLAGKSSPIRVHELICRLEESSDAQRSLCAIFNEALDAFTKQSWDMAIKSFSECRDVFGEDGPSEYYLRLCERYIVHRPDGPWDGSIRLSKK